MAASQHKVEKQPEGLVWTLSFVLSSSKINVVFKNMVLESYMLTVKLTELRYERSKQKYEVSVFYQFHLNIVF